MQYFIYRNTNRNSEYPYLVDVQSEIIGELASRIVIPLYPLNQFKKKQVKRLNPVIQVEGEEFLVMTHEMASVRVSLLGDQVMDARVYRQRIKDSVDFIFDGF
ncbi:CcdB family protein [Pantoea sp. CTOTU49201]|uniref:CcdB family protein n=1 Tax=Pantoea sp. CTOTU49201 TaxID=2953855 RepID=UPI0028A193EC|nr:CcdB family protein [Pantoea sp. CTOTU49201]